MSFIDILFKDLLTWAKKVVIQQWRGALVTTVLWMIVWLVFVKPTVDRFNDVGTFVGSFTISKGERETISQPDLVVGFDDAIQRVLQYENFADTEYYYPRFVVYADGKGGKRHSKFEVGRRLSVATANYIYTLELEQLDESGADTVAHIMVHRKEYPETRRDNR